MDNRIFNVNGISKQQLFFAIKLALTDESGTENLVSSWEVDLNKGFIINWWNERGIKFPKAFSADMITDVVWEWLQTEEAMSMTFEGWDAKQNESSKLGFRVYCEDWGHVGTNEYAIIAVRPAYIWYGK